jgi:predicted anti-sigma-YlaC factor YlaD
MIVLPRVTNERRRNMKKLAYVLAALATIAVAAPTVASAQGFSVRIGATEITTIATATITGPVLSSMHMIAACIAAGIIMMATEG